MSTAKIKTTTRKSKSMISVIYNKLISAGDRGLTVKASGTPRLRDYISRLRASGSKIETAKTRDNRTKYVLKA